MNSTAVKQVKRRTRSKNYIEEEKDNLLNIIEKYKSIIENKRTDSIWAAEKSKAWEQIAIEFNSCGKTGIRSGTQLKFLYDNLKKNAKQRKAANDKIATCGTVGQGRVSSLTKMDERVIAVLGLQISPHRNTYDSNEDFNINMEDESLLVRDSPANRPVQVEDHEERISNDGSKIPNGSSRKRSSAPPLPMQKRRVNNVTTEFPQRAKTTDFHKEEIFLMKKEKHNAEMEILRIIKEKEETELETRKVELRIKQFMLQKETK